MVTEKTLKELGFEMDPMDPFTGKSIWIKDNFTYYPSENTISFNEHEFANIKRTVNNERFFRIFIEALTINENKNKK